MRPNNDNDDTLDEDGVYVPNNIWGWNGLARQVRLERKDLKELRRHTPPRILERIIPVSDLRNAIGDV